MKFYRQYMVLGALVCASVWAEQPRPELPCDPKIALPAMVIAAERAVVHHFEGQKAFSIHVVDPEWAERIAAVLKRAVYVRDEYCFCLSYPMVDFYLGERRLTFSLHHGDKLRCSSGAVSGDFKVGRETVQALSTLLLERKRFAPPIPKS